jgi:hypothetical protein
MTELSPSAQTVLNAANMVFSQAGTTAQGIAATLRAVADQLWLEMPLGDTDADAGVFAAHRAICVKFLAIATELEGHA